MRGAFWVAIVSVAAVVGIGPEVSAFAHGWDLAVDTPVEFTFDKSGPNKPAPGNTAAKWSDTTSTNVSGSKVMLTTPLHIGIGYEDYSVIQKINAGGGCTGNCSGHGKESIQMVDVMVHLPIAGFNVGLGYGQGQANFDAIVAAAPGNPNSAHHAAAEQVFLVLGIPTGKNWDVHLGYHWITVSTNKDIKYPTQTSGFDQFQGSGEMLSLGVQYSWGR